MARKSPQRSKKGTRRAATGAPKKASAAVRPAPRTPAADVGVVGIGASAGGVQAFSALVSHLPADTGLAFVLIQHLDPTRESGLAEIVGRSTRMPVVQVADGMRLAPNHVYVISPNTELSLRDGAFSVEPRLGRGPQMAIDAFFRSLAEAKGNRAIGVVLSGTMTDGALGLRAIKAAGGITFAQDEESAAHPQMPRAAVSAGAVDFVLPPEGIAAELAHAATRKYVAEAHEVVPPEPFTGAEMTRLMAILRTSTGVDFTNYRQTTLRRRVARRLALRRVAELPQYLDLLRQDKDEARALYEDVLITVTSFFRDPPLFDALKEKVFPSILKGRSGTQPVRLWIPGCSTGEEVYSLGIVLFEAVEALRVSPPIQIFATDVSEQALEKARAGLYLESSMADVSPERSKRFFSKVDGGFRISKAIRDVCVFARQNLVSDPPFSKLDLLSCRNLLIYLEPVLQKRVFPLFHYALNPNGYLVLGTAESIGSFEQLFVAVDRSSRIFAKRPGVANQPADFGRQAARASEAGAAPAQPLPALDISREADKIVLGRYAPAGILVNDKLEIVQFRGKTSPYLEASAGAASFSLVKFAREGLVAELRGAILKARKSGTRVRREGVTVRRNGGYTEVTLEVVPIPAEGGRESHYLVLFEEAGKPARPALARAAKSLGRDRDERIARLEGELTSTKEHLQTLIESQEATNEELKSANEEILSANEELQSTNEELETAKEELQSTNEELTTVNEELQNRNLELSVLNTDLTNLLAGINIPVVMTSADGRIRRFTGPAEKLLHLQSTDVGRPIRELRLDASLGDLAEVVSGVVETVTPREEEVRDAAGRWYVMRARPARTADNRIDGAILSFLDIDLVKKSLEAAQRARDYAEALMETLRESLLVLDGELRVRAANPPFYRTFRREPSEVEGRSLFELPEWREHESEVREPLEDLETEEARRDWQLELDIEGLGRKTILANARRIRLPGEAKPLLLLALEDVTERNRLEEKLREAQKLESIGRLAGGIAHDFNNLLNVISAHAALVARKGQERGAENLEAIGKAVQRGSAVVRQLLTFARRSEVLFEDVDVNTVADEVARLLAETLPSSITLSTKLDPSLPRVKADANQLHQAVLNLCVNARDAMPDGGRLEIATEGVAGRSGPWVAIRVSDTGLGMDEETRNRIFEPFFTTKESTRAGGLGLAVVYGIVNGHGGAIEVDSEPGKGTTLRLLLPVEAPESAQGAFAAPGARGSRPAILVVEDEEILRKALRDVLEGDGYEVLDAGDGERALELFEAQGSRVGVAVVDLNLPKVGGRELFRRMRRRSRDVKVVFATGEDDARVLEPLKREKGVATVRKPYQLDEILGAVRRVLASG